MTGERHLVEKLSFAELHLELRMTGEDIALLLYGGDRPHIGCAVLAVPRPSLTGDGSMGCTSSVLNITGHKDEVICRVIAETVCRRYGAVTVCVGGFHADKLTTMQIAEVEASARRLAEAV